MSAPTPNPVSLPARAIIFLLRVYQRCLSPFFGNCCRFSPSCSNYMLEAVRLHGVMSGVFLGLKRLARCHPWNPGGFDPVPPPRHKESISNGTHHHE